MDIQKIGQLIVSARKEKGLTQKKLAERLHVSDRAVSKWERGLNLPEVGLFEPLCQTLGLTVTELLQGERKGPEQPEPPAPVLRRSVVTMMALAQEEKKREMEKKALYRKRILLLAVLLVVVAVVGAALRGWLWQRQLDRDDAIPMLILHKNYYPSMTVEMQITYDGAYGPFETGGSLVQHPLTISQFPERARHIHRLRMEGQWSQTVRFSFSFEKTHMEVKALRWPLAVWGEADMEDGEEVPVWGPSSPSTPEGGPEYTIENLEPDYLYSVIVSWGDGYYVAFPFYTTFSE